MPEFADFHGAYHNVLSSLLSVKAPTAGVSSSHSIGSKFGDNVRDTYELIAHSFTITNPRNRLLPCRNADTRYAVANLFWTLAGDGDAEAIIHYNPHGKAFLEDSELKCAIPARLSNESGGNQLVDAINLLKKDPASRRAIVTFLHPEDILKDSLDFPCPSTIHFMIRDNALTAIVNMRSQSAYGVLPYDVYLFTMIQEAVAVELGVELGKYIHISNSIHLYADEVERAQNLGRCSTEKVLPMVDMTAPTPISDKSLLDAETSVRETGKFGKTGQSYWDDRLTELVL